VSTPVFDTTYQYMFSAVATNGNPMVMDVGTSPIQQWNQSANLASSAFMMAANGSSWTISPANQSGNCVDAGAASSGTGLVLNSCSGASSQKWNISANAANGSFTVVNASTNRCMNIRGGSTSAGAVMEVAACSSGSTSQQFNIQATVVAVNTSNFSGGGGSGGSSSTFAPSQIYRMIPQNAPGESIDVCNGGQTTGTCVQQYATQSVNTNQDFYLLANGTDWTINMAVNRGKCLGPSYNGTANSTAIVVQDCNGSTAQNYTAMPMSTSGVYAFKNVLSQRCLNVAGNTTANSARLIIWDCGTTPPTNAQFKVQ